MLQEELSAVQGDAPGPASSLCPLLVSLQEIPVCFVLGSPELGAVLWLRPDQAGQKAEPRAAEGGAGSGASGKAGVPGTTIGGRGYGVKANGGGAGPLGPPWGLL